MQLGLLTDLEEEGQLGVSVRDVALATCPLCFYKLHDDTTQRCEGAIDGACLLEVLACCAR